MRFGYFIQISLFFIGLFHLHLFFNEKTFVKDSCIINLSI